MTTEVGFERGNRRKGSGLAVPFTDAEIEIAAHEWGANCGPGALSAATGRSLGEVRDALTPSWPGYTNVGHQEKALRRMGLSSRRTRSGVWPWTKFGSMTGRGLVFVQWLGPWMEKHWREQCQQTHWVATYAPADRLGVLLFDVSYPAWLTIYEWEKIVAPDLHDDGWKIRSGLEILL